jgi:hypothetical protein
VAQHVSTWLMAIFLAVPPIGGIPLSPAGAPTGKVEWQEPSKDKPKPQKPPRMEPRGEKGGKSTGEPVLKRRKPPSPPPTG